MKTMTASEWISNIRVGWNLGNTLEAKGGRYGFPWLGGGIYQNTSVVNMETAWGSSVVTREL